MKVIKNDLQVQDKVNYILDRYIRFPYKYRSRVGYDCLIQNVILKDIINIMYPTITDLDI